jgi:hypothetical protein
VIKRPVSEEELPKIKKIGVVSTLGNTFNVIYIGFTVFNNSSSKAKVNEWNVDKYIVDASLAELQKNPNFTSVAFQDNGMTIDDLRSDKGKKMWEAAAQQGLDTLVIIYPSVSDNYRIFTPGYGLFERPFSSQRCVYAGYVVSVNNVALQKEIAWEWGGEMPCEIMNSADDVSMHPRLEDFSTEEKTKLHEELDARLTKTLSYAMKKLRLVN